MADVLSVIIATADRPVLLERTLSSLSTCEKPSIYREAVVVENGPKTDAEEIVLSCDSSLNARYMHVSRANKCYALNEALKTVKDGLIFFIDDDVRMHSKILMAYAEAAEGFSSGQFYGGPTGTDYEQEPPAWLKGYLPPSARGWGLNGGIQSEHWKFFLGFNWAAFSQDLKALGGFDPELGPGTVAGIGDEGNMQQRLMKSGVKQVYTPDAMVWHYVPRERCSPCWILGRKFRNGVAAGMHRAGDENALKAIPRIVAGCAYSGLLFLWYAVLADEINRFDALYRFRYCRGFLLGFRQKLIYSTRASTSSVRTDTTT